MEKLQVCKSNALVEAGYRLSLGEHKIILACIAQVRRDEPISSERLYEVSALEVAERSAITRQAAYMELKGAADTLFERHVSVRTGPDGKPPIIRKFRWVQAIEYVQDAGVVRVQFSSPILPYLAELTERFTVYPIEDVSRLTSVHAIRLYELLVQWKGTGQREVELEWLRRAFMIEDAYKSISDLKKYVIDIAVRQINEHTPLQVSWTQRKTGRKVTHLAFTFAPKEAAKKLQKPPAPPAEKPHKPRKPKAETAPTAGGDAVPGYAAALAKRAGLTPAQITRKARPGETWEQAATRLAREASAAEAD